MIEAEVSLSVYSNVTGRAGSWGYRTRMRFDAVPRIGEEVVWGGIDHEVTDTVKRVYYYAEGSHRETEPAVAIELYPTKTDSPDILNQLMELHQSWEQLGGPWKGQAGEPAP